MSSQRARGMLPASFDLELIEAQIDPAFEEFNAINGGGPEHVDLSRDRDDPEAAARSPCDHPGFDRACRANHNADAGMHSRSTRPPQAWGRPCRSPIEPARGLRAAERFLETGDRKT